MEETYSGQILDHNIKKNILCPILNNIISKYKIMSDINNTKSPSVLVMNHVSSFTSLPEEEIMSIIYAAPPTSLLNINDRITLLMCIKLFYENINLTLNYDNLYQYIMASNLPRHLKDKDFFCTELNYLNYHLMETVNGSKLLIENQKIKHERMLFLKKMLEMRKSNKRIVYIDVRVIDSVLKIVKKPISNNISDEDTVLFHACDINGLITCLFTNQPLELNKWIIDVLLQHIDNAIIVMDRNPFHEKCHINKITRYHSKNDMLKWLSQNDIPYDKHMLKCELFELIQKYNYKEEYEYKIDKKLISYGYEVMRLPHSFQELSLTHMFWDEVNDVIDIENKLKYTGNYTQIIKDTLQGHKKWKDYDDEIQSIENKLLNLDIDIDLLLENYKIKLE